MHEFQNHNIVPKKQFAGDAHNDSIYTGFKTHKTKFIFVRLR